MATLRPAIAGHVVMSEQMLRDLVVTERAILAHEDRCRADPEYAARWAAGVDWDAIEESYDDLEGR